MPLRGATDDGSVPQEATAPATASAAVAATEATAPLALAGFRTTGPATGPEHENTH